MHRSVTSMSAEYCGMRPLCPCCQGGAWRKGYTHTKAASRAHNNKAHRGDAPLNKHLRRSARPDKF